MTKTRDFQDAKQHQQLSSATRSKTTSVRKPAPMSGLAALGRYVGTTDGAPAIPATTTVASIDTHDTYYAEAESDVLA